MGRIAHFFSVSQIDPDNERRRRLLTILLAITLALASAGFAYAFFLDIADLANELVIHSLYRAAAMMMVSVICAYAISRYRTSRLAGLVFALLFTISVILNPGEEILWKNIYLFLATPILISSFLAFPWAGFLIAGLISSWVAFVAQETEAPLNIPAVLGYFSLAAATWLSSRSLEHTLTKLRTANQELDRRIIDQERAEAALQQRNRGLRFLNRAGQAFNSTLDLDEVLASVFGEIQHSTNVEAWSVWLTDRETHELVCHLVGGHQRERVQNLRLKMGTGIAGWTALHRETVLISDANNDPRIIRALNGVQTFDMRSVLSVPLIRKGNVIGAIQILSRKPDIFTAEDQALLELLATSAAAAIDNAQLYKAAQREITERKRAETALRESEARYRTLIDTSPDAIIAYDRDGTILTCNPQAAALYGARDIGEIVGQSAADFTLEEDRSRAAETMQTALVNETIRNQEFTQRKIDGTHFPTEISLAAFPNGKNGSPTAIAVIRDITARKEAERITALRHKRIAALNAIVTTLNQKHNLDELLAETLNEVLRVMGLDTGWIQLFQIDKEGNTPHLKARSSCPKPPPAGLIPAALTEDLVRQARQKGTPALVESVTATIQQPGENSEKRITFPVAAFPIKAGERVEGVLGVLGIADCQTCPLNADEIQLLTTISYQIGTAVENNRLVKESAEVEALRALDKLRAELIANFSHDLRTPLGLIKMSCTTLMRTDVQFERETRIACLEDIETQVDALTEIVDNILDLARIESGQLKLDKHPTDLATLARETLNTTRARLTQHTVTLDFPDTPLIADVDSRRIVTVFHNLLDNAIKYSRKGSAITISGHGDDGHILIQVRDRGIGIPAEALDKIFERFYRVESKATRHIRGVGLGLPVCQGIITAHRGKIWVESTLGRGSAFFFTLPISSNEQTTVTDGESPIRQ